MGKEGGIEGREVGKWRRAMVDDGKVNLSSIFRKIRESGSVRSRHQTISGASKK